MTPGAAPDPLIADLLEWIGPGSRPYSEVIEAWRTSCPRLPVWEDANDMRLVSRRRRWDGVAIVSVSATGRRWLREQDERPGALPTRLRPITGPRETKERR